MFKTVRITVLGTRGFPGVQGGVEAHCEKLYSRLAELGCKITVFTRVPYVNPRIKSYEGVELLPLGCPKSKSFEAIIHTLRGTFTAKKTSPDILHIHAVGPSLVIPLARILGMQVVMTNHGPDYKRKKWGMGAKLFLRLGEMLGSCFANEVICISEVIADDIKRKYNRDSHIIPNGVEIPEVLKSRVIFNKYSLKKDKYVLTVGRFVPEKGFVDLIDAFGKAGLKDWKLVIVGSADHESEYSRTLRERATENQDVILTGFLSGDTLKELYSHAGLFVLPSFYEGLPIVLLEAMSYGLLCLASDIPANRCVTLPDENYFTAGDIKQLSGKLKGFAKKSLTLEQKSRQIEIVRQRYDWGRIAQKTLMVYNKVIHG